MEILIIDHLPEHEMYKQAFGTHNYEGNSLLFACDFQQAKEFMTEELATKKRHIDLIITGNSAFSDGGDTLKAKEMLFFKDGLANSYSASNFRICAIPILLHTENTGEQKLVQKSSFDAVVARSSTGNYRQLVQQAERLVRNWRRQLQDDLKTLCLQGKQLKNFAKSKEFRDKYQPRIAKNTGKFFEHKTSVVSLQFIQCPQELAYDWITLTSSKIEQQLNRYSKGFRHHKPYTRKDNENTIIHPLLKDNKVVLLRDSYQNLLHETAFPQTDRFSKRCDFILKPGIPDYQQTTWFEVKKEDVHYFTGHSKKDQYLTAQLHRALGQLWMYKKYAENTAHDQVIKERIGYVTRNYTYLLLAGRAEEKEAFQERLDEALADHYTGLQLLSYEDLEVKTGHYLERFDRLGV